MSEFLPLLLRFSLDTAQKRIPTWYQCLQCSIHRYRWLYADVRIHPFCGFATLLDTGFLGKSVNIIRFKAACQSPVRSNSHQPQFRTMLPRIILNFTTLIKWKKTLQQLLLSTRFPRSISVLNCHGDLHSTFGTQKACAEQIFNIKLQIEYSVDNHEMTGAP